MHRVVAGVINLIRLISAFSIYIKVFYRVERVIL